MQITPFTNLGISGDIQKSLNRMKFTEPTKVQALTIAPFLEGKDLLVQAPTGTGKTGAFGMPIVQQIDISQKTTQALILGPTRELALQITGVLRSLSQGRPGIRIATIYGGESINKQISALRVAPHIIVATPGRLLDHMQRRTVRLFDVRTVVLDEADRMLDMGFRRDMEKILQAMPSERQTVMFSATFPLEIYSIASQFQKHAEEIRVEQKTPAVETVKQYYTAVEPGGKNDALRSLLKKNDFPLTLVFVNMKHRADKVAVYMQREGFRAAALHGDMNQNQRDRVMKKYRLGELDTLIATDVASRGIDVKNIDAVINYDAPLDNESYVHRIGRTGRAEQEGVAFTLFYEDEADRMRQMISGLKIDISPTEDSQLLPEKSAQASFGKVSGSSFHSINNRRSGRSRRLLSRSR